MGDGQVLGNSQVLIPGKPSRFQYEACRGLRQGAAAEAAQLLEGSGASDLSLFQKLDAVVPRRCQGELPPSGY